MDATWSFAGPRGTRMRADVLDRRAVVGRDPTADVQVCGPEADLLFISRHHLVLELDSGRWWVTCEGKHGWEIAATADRPLAPAPPGVPYPVVDGMRVRMPDNERLGRRRRRRRPELRLGVNTHHADQRPTPDGDEPAGEPMVGPDLWTGDETAHRLAVHLVRHRDELPSATQLETDLEVSHGTLYNHLAAVERYLGVTYDRQASGGRSKAAFLADALARHPVYRRLATAGPGDR